LSCYLSITKFFFDFLIYYKELALDIIWVISVSLVGIGVTTVILAIINILVGRMTGKNNNTKANGLVR
jgi:hypothetical protein